jgi:CBS domain-containing protein
VQTQDHIGSLAGHSEGRDTVAEFMNPPITISPDARLQDAVDLMLKNVIHRLVVVDPEDPEEPPLGLISTTDIVVEMASPGSAWAETAS